MQKNQWYVLTIILTCLTFGAKGQSLLHLKDLKMVGKVDERFPVSYTHLDVYKRQVKRLRYAARGQIKDRQVPDEPGRPGVVVLGRLDEHRVDVDADHSVASRVEVAANPTGTCLLYTSSCV